MPLAEMMLALERAGTKLVTRHVELKSRRAIRGCAAFTADASRKRRHETLRAFKLDFFTRSRSGPCNAPSYSSSAFTRRRSVL